MKMFTRISLALGLLLGGQWAFAQNEFYNDGASVYVQAGGLIYVQGDVINDDGGTVGRMYNSGDIQLTGNWSNTSTSPVFQAFDLGTTTFLGTGAVQTIGGTSDTYFNNLTILKSGAATQEVRQLRDAANDGILNLTNDFLNTQTFRFLVGSPLSGAIVRAGGNAPDYMHTMTGGYVTSTPGSVGRLARTTVATQRYFFPVGNGTRWRPVEITPALGAPNNVYAVQFVNLPTFSPTVKAATLSTINPAWYHFLERGVPTAVSENIRIYHDFAADNICDINNVTMAEWNSALWADLSPVTSTNPAPFMSWTQKSPYPAGYPTPWNTNAFALAGLFLAPNISSCVFPVEYVYLEANALESTIMLDWETATEINNAGFEVNRSTDGVNFEPIGWVPGVGNSTNPTPYQFEDINVVPNQQYFYRLRQVDQNGGNSISNTVNAIILKGKDFVVGGFYPNPSDGNVHLSMSLSKDVSFDMEVFNAIGQLVYTESRDMQSGYHKLDFNFTHLSKGSYIANVRIGNEVLRRKLVLE